MTKKNTPKTPHTTRENRVQFPTQRVKPATLAEAKRLRAKHGGLGRVLDHWAESDAKHGEQLIGHQRALDAVRRKVTDLENRQGAIH